MPSIFHTTTKHIEDGFTAEAAFEALMKDKQRIKKDVDVYRWCTVDGMDPWMLIMYLWVDSAHKLYITNAFVSG